MSGGAGKPRPFRFGLQAFDATSGAEWCELAVQAEALGYSALHLTDHYFGPGAIADASGHRPVDLAPIAAMATAAAVTTDLRVGCRVFCVDYHHPVVLAKEAATVDLLSDGRLELGLGAGWLAAEYEGLGVPMEGAGTRISRLDEVIGLVKAHWSGEPLDVEGEHVQVHGFAGLPRPVQRPHPPIMVGGGSPRVLGLAGREADIVSLNFDNRSGTLGAAGVRSGTADRTAEKVGWVRDGAGDRFGDIELEIAAYFVALTDQADATIAGMAGRFGIEPGELAEHPHALIGSVDHACELLAERRERYGVSYVTVAQRHMAEFAPVVERMAGR